MAKKSGQKARILELKQLFEEETDQSKGFTSAELCGKFDINRKSIYDDIEVLSASGFEIMKQKSGQTTYYYHDDKLFELSELKLLTDAVLSSRVISEKQSKKIIDKLKSLTGPSYRSVLNRQIYSNKNKHDITNQITYVIDEAQIAIAEHKNTSSDIIAGIWRKACGRHPGQAL